MAQRCAPDVAPITLASIARVESGNNPHALNNNTTGASLASGDAPTSLATASSWLAQGHSIDVGLMQINSSNFGWLNISIADAFDPCISLAAAARVLAGGFAGGHTEEQRQTALLVALSRYNTGSPDRGFSNGYVDKVVSAARHVVPAIHIEGAEVGSPPSSDQVNISQSNWDVWADDRQSSPPTPDYEDRLQDAPSSVGAMPSVLVEKSARLPRTST